MTTEESNKQYFDKEYCLRIRGDFACFTRPEMKVERVSYDVITPSAARAIFQAIFWKPAIEWEITRIEVLAPIKRYSILRNEVGALMNPKSDGINAAESRRQRSSYILRDVDYRISAKMKFIPIGDRSEACQKHYREVYTEEERRADNPAKYQAMFERRAKAGQCFTMPYLGCREFTCSFEYVDLEEELLPAPIDETRDLGYMLYDLDFQQNPQCPPPMFFHATLEHGVVCVPSRDSQEIRR